MDKEYCERYHEMTRNMLNHFLEQMSKESRKKFTNENNDLVIKLKRNYLETLFEAISETFSEGESVEFIVDTDTPKPEMVVVGLDVTDDGMEQPSICCGNMQCDPEALIYNVELHYDNDKIILDPQSYAATGFSGKKPVVWNEEPHTITIETHITSK